MKMLGTNGGGFYGMNSAHPFENPDAASNFLTTSSMMWFPMALVFMYGRMLQAPSPFGRHIFGDVCPAGRYHFVDDLLRHAQTESRPDCPFAEHAPLRFRALLRRVASG